MKSLIAVVSFLILPVVLSAQNGSSGDGQFVYRDRMISFVRSISDYAKELKSGFIVVPQNGVLLLTKGNSLDPDYDYLNAIDGVGRESVFYGYHAEDTATPERSKQYILNFLKLARDHNKQVLVIDYCSTKVKVDRSYSVNDSLGFVSFAASRRNLDVIPDYPPNPHEVHAGDIESLNDIENFLYLINTVNYSDKSEFIRELSQTNYDMIVVDLFFHDKDGALTPEDINRLKVKPNGGDRIVLAYMSIGEAEDYRYYWKDDWNHNPPEWMRSENPNWGGNYLVEYWHPGWQDIIIGGENAYLDRIINAGFDGVYLDLVDAYHYFEND